jgi:hypothetical protein
MALLWSHFKVRSTNDEHWEWPNAVLFQGQRQCGYLQQWSNTYRMLRVLFSDGLFDLLQDKDLDDEFHHNIHGSHRGGFPRRCYEIEDHMSNSYATFLLEHRIITFYPSWILCDGSYNADAGTWGVGIVSFHSGEISYSGGVVAHSLVFWKELLNSAVFEALAMALAMSSIYKEIFWRHPQGCDWSRTTEPLILVTDHQGLIQAIDDLCFDAPGARLDAGGDGMDLYDRIVVVLVQQMGCMLNIIPNIFIICKQDEPEEQTHSGNTWLPHTVANFGRENCRYSLGRVPDFPCAARPCVRDRIKGRQLVLQASRSTISHEPPSHLSFEWVHWWLFKQEINRCLGLSSSSGAETS